MGSKEKETDSHFFHNQENAMNTPTEKTGSPQLLPLQEHSFLSEKDSCFEDDNISNTEDNISNIGGNLSGDGESIPEIVDSISGLGDNISGMVDHMMADVPPGVMDLSSIAVSSGDCSAVVGSHRESDFSKSNSVKHHQHCYDNKQSLVEETEDEQSPALSQPDHRLPSGPFVTGAQLGLAQGNVTSMSCLESMHFSSPLGSELNPFLGHSLLDKFKWIPGSRPPSNNPMKKLLDYQNVPSRPFHRQQRVRNDLSLADKVRLINVSESTGKSQRALAAEFNISVGSVNNILRRKYEYREAFEKSSVPNNSTQSRLHDNNCGQHKSAKVAHNELQVLIMRWLKVARAKVKSLTWPFIMEKVREFASKLNISDLSLSADWLQNLRQLVDVPVQVIPVGVRSESDATLMGMWHKMLPFLIQGYQAKDIFSVTETTLYFKCLPDCCYIGGPMCQTSSSHLENLDHRLTVLLCCSMLGERLKPLVISRHACPLSLRGVPLEELPVVWCEQPSAAITSDIFADWLCSLELSMGQQKRQIALFMEMTPCHLSSTLLKHVSLKFYLDDSSHLLQPLNQGVVRDFKVRFRRRLLQTAMGHHSPLDGVCDRGSQAVKSVTELDAVFWIQEAWHSINSAIIETCFHKAAFPQPTEHQRTMFRVEPLPFDFIQLVLEAGQVFGFTPMVADIYAEFDSQLTCHNNDMDELEKTLLSEASSCDGLKSIKREPSDCFVDDDDDPSGGFNSSSREEVSEKGIGPSEALDCMGKLKLFSSGNIGLLTSVFRLEGMLLDSIGSSLNK